MTSQNKAIVVGAGISGIRAALDLAETGHRVLLIDRAPHIGGILSQLDYQFPSNRCGMCKMLPLLDRDASSQYCLRKGLFHENIEIMLSTELTGIEGEPGNFRVTLKQKSGRIDPSRCIGCGVCVSVCPVEVKDEFNQGLSHRKAVYLPVPHAIPNPYLIDTTVCTRCGACADVCPTDAISMLPIDRQQFRILIVDDEFIMRDSLKEILENEGYAADTAESGDQALEKLAQQPYRILFTDIKMPGMDGVELIQKAKSAHPDLTMVMMTAYATVETAVEAMKIGALDYLIKPFDTDAVLSMTLKIYQAYEMALARKEEVGAVILAGGTGYFNPAEGKNVHSYGGCPNVITNLEFERIFSGTGPTQGKLIRSDGKPVRKVAWLHCIGSRDIQENADFCSSYCCMAAVKEALTAKEKTNGEIETILFYMDMRAFGKSFQRYCDEAEQKGVRFQRARIHSASPDSKTGDVVLRYVDTGGNIHVETVDMAVLAVGQRPSPGTAELAKLTGIELNPWGFVQTAPHSLSLTNKPGMVIAGSFSGLKDISESIIQASSASLNASRWLKAQKRAEDADQKTQGAGAQSAAVALASTANRILVILCLCGEKFNPYLKPDKLISRWKQNPEVVGVEFIHQACVSEGQNAVAELVKKHQANQLLIGGCLSYVYALRKKELGSRIGVDPSQINAEDIATPIFVEISPEEKMTQIQCMIEMGLAHLSRSEPSELRVMPVQQRALVIGGGISGIRAALAMADQGFPVHLVEQSDKLGGNLIWLNNTLEGHSLQALRDEMVKKVQKHPMIQVHLNTRVIGAYGQVGEFLTTLDSKETGTQTIEHGVTLLATGGTEAPAAGFGYGKSPSVITQKMFEEKRLAGALDPKSLNTVVMIQCAGSREEPRNYCSRICCPTSLKQALWLKEQNSEIDIYILYRDIMTCGFAETYYTQARRAGVIFIQYSKDSKPEVVVTNGSPYVHVLEPIIGKPVHIETDLVLLATGVVPHLPDSLAAMYGASVDQDGFFREAESKWRPVDSMAEGVFSCGLALSPRSVAESIATAEAAAQRALRILTKKRIPAGRIAAKVHESLCSLCERCIDVCPYGARSIDSAEERIVVNPVRCQGCGSCAAACPNGASFIQGFSRQQLLAVVDAAVDRA